MASRELTQDEELGGVPSRIEVDGTQDRFEGIRQDGGLLAPARRLLTPAQQEDLADAEAVGHLGQHAGVHHGRAHLGQHPLGEAGIALVAVPGHDEPQHGIAEELESLVGGRTTLLLAAPAPMGQRVLQKTDVAEVVTQARSEPDRPFGASVTPPRAWRRRSQRHPVRCAGLQGLHRRCGTRRSAPPVLLPAPRPVR